MNKSMENKVIAFYTAISNVYREEEERECMTQLTLKDDLTEDFTAMLVALKSTYEIMTGEKIDLVDFIGILNRLAFMFLMNKETEDNE